MALNHTKTLGYCLLLTVACSSLLRLMTPHSIDKIPSATATLSAQQVTIEQWGESGTLTLVAERVSGLSEQHFQAKNIHLEQQHQDNFWQISADAAQMEDNHEIICQGHVVIKHYVKQELQGTLITERAIFDIEKQVVHTPEQAVLTTSEATLTEHNATWHKNDLSNSTDEPVHIHWDKTVVSHQDK